MKVAVCLSGQPRTWRITNSYLKKNSLEQLDCDFFIHTWTGNSRGCMDDGTERKFENPEELEQGLKSAYSPQEMLIEENRLTPEVQLKGPWKKFHSTIYSFSKSMMLFRKHLLKYPDKKYDLLVWTRFDVILRTPINTLDLDNLQPFEIRGDHVPNISWGYNSAGLPEAGGPCICDWYLIAEPLAAYGLSEMFYWWRETTPFQPFWPKPGMEDFWGRSTGMNFESLMFTYAIHKKLNWNCWKPCNLSPAIIRDSVEAKKLNLFDIRDLSIAASVPEMCGMASFEEECEYIERKKNEYSNLSIGKGNENTNLI